MRVSFTAGARFSLKETEELERLIGPSTLACAFPETTRYLRENRRSRGCPHFHGRRLRFAYRVPRVRGRSAGAWYLRARVDCSQPTARPVRGREAAIFQQEQFR